MTNNNKIRNLGGSNVRESYVYADFSASPITNRIVSCLSQLSMLELASLVESGKLVIPRNDDPDAIFQTLTYRNLRWHWIDDYAQICNVPLRFFLFGENLHEKTYYSHFDEVVLPLLNTLPVSIIQAATEVVHGVYYNPRFRISSEDTPSAKILAIAVTGSRMPELVPEGEQDRYQTDINEELSRLRAVRLKERFIFHLDYVLDMCTYCHVSPHWVFSLSGPLLCETAEADAFFDLFCLLSRQQQAAVLAMLVSLCQLANPKIDGEALRKANNAIEQEGGAVL